MLKVSNSNLIKKIVTGQHSTNSSAYDIATNGMGKGLGNFGGIYVPNIAASTLPSKDKFSITLSLIISCLFCQTTACTPWSPYQ